MLISQNGWPILDAIPAKVPENQSFLGLKISS